MIMVSNKGIFVMRRNLFIFLIIVYLLVSISRIKAEEGNVILYKILDIKKILNSAFPCYFDSDKYGMLYDNNEERYRKSDDAYVCYSANHYGGENRAIREIHSITYHNKDEDIISCSVVPMKGSLSTSIPTLSGTTIIMSNNDVTYLDPKVYKSMISIFEED